MLSVSCLRTCRLLAAECSIAWYAPHHCGVHVRQCCCVCVQISKKYTHYAAITLFMYFGLRMLYDVATGAESVRPRIVSPVLPVAAG